MPRNACIDSGTKIWWLPTGSSISHPSPTLNEIYSKGVEITNVILDEPFKAPFTVFKEDKVHGLEAQARTARENTSINNSVDLEYKLLAFISNKIKSEAHQQLLNEVAAQMSVLRTALQEAQVERFGLLDQIENIRKQFVSTDNDKIRIEAELLLKIKILKKRVYKLAKLLAARA